MPQKDLKPTYISATFFSTFAYKMFNITLMQLEEKIISKQVLPDTVLRTLVMCN